MNHFKVSIGRSKSKSIIIVYYNQIRHRYWNGKAIDVNLKSFENATLLKAAFELKLLEGWKPKPKEIKVKAKPITVIQALEKGIQTKTAQGCSERFIKDAKRVVTLWRRYESKQQIKSLTLDDLQPSHIRNFLVRPNWSPKTQRTVKSTLSPLLKEFKPQFSSKCKTKETNIYTSQTF